MRLRREGREPQRESGDHQRDERNFVQPE
jgi:hypothetical protein